MFKAPGEFHTRDLFSKVKEGFYMYLGRKDDLLVHITGEKSNPVEMESMIDKCKYVKKSAVIGHNRAYNIIVF